MRSRIVGRGSRPRNNSTRWLAALVYIQEHPEVRDVLISGGDPLILEDDALDFIIRQLRRIPHVEMIRIGTKMPMSLPQRITTSLTSMLKKYHPLWMSLHVTHPDELTPECRTACSRLADAGIPLGSQTVLLKGVNDSLPTLKALMHGLIRFRVKPYYLFQCDPIPGTSHFRTPVSKGLEMIQGLQGHTSGYAVPTFAVDAPGGGGKIPLLPEYLVGRDENGLILRNYEGKIFCYPDKGVLTG
jgi:lysine 2,3-aminomutase